MVSVIIYVVVTLVVAVVLFLASTVLFGRGESLPPVGRGETLTKLPRRNISGGDVRDLEFGVRARGYDMSEVDWAIEQLAAEIDRLKAGETRETTGETDLGGQETGSEPPSAVAPGATGDGDVDEPESMLPRE